MANKANRQDEPIVVDNPEFAFDLLNDDGINTIPPDGSTTVTRKCSPLTQIIIFDSNSKDKEFLAFNLEPKTPVTFLLHKDETPGNDPGEAVTISVAEADSLMTLECKDGTKVKADSMRPTKFKISTPKPKRGIFAVELTIEGATQPQRYVLDKKGRHIVFVIPGAKRGLVNMTAVAAGGH